MKKLLLLVLLFIPIGIFAQRKSFTLKPYLYSIDADTMYILPADKAFGVVVSVPNWATDSANVSGLTETSEDGHTTSSWLVAPGENINISWDDYPLDSLTIIGQEKVRIGIFKK